MSVSKSGWRNAIWKAPTIFFHSMVWFERVVFSVMETAGLAVPMLLMCLAMMSSRRDLFLLTLKALFLKEAQIALFYT